MFQITFNYSDFMVNTVSLEWIFFSPSLYDVPHSYITSPSGV